MERRGFLAIVAMGGAIFTAALGIPTLLNVLSPARSRRGSSAWRAVGPLDEFPVGEVVVATVSIDRGDWSAALNEKSVYVWRETDDQVVVFSRNCTDLSCPVKFDQGSACFFCPCHGGIFGKDGSPMAGPPQVPLYRYANRVRDGLLEIDLHSLPPMT